jgi:hypothetical protein
VREFEYGVVCTPDDDSLGPRTGCLPRDGTAAVHPISEYVDFLGLVKSDPSITMVAGITSPPGPVTVIDTMGNPGAGTLDLEGACTPPPGPCADNPLMTCARKPALPAVRLDAFMTQFPARYALASICDQTMLARVHQISRAVSGVMTNRPCLIGDVTTAMLAPDRCRAFDVDASGSRSEIGATISEDATMCDYTTSHLRADIPEVAMGHHVVFECLK